jgi:hypothetical protein
MIEHGSVCLIGLVFIIHAHCDQASDAFPAYDYSPPLSTSSPLDTVNSVHACPPTLTGQSLSSSPTASMGPTVHVQDEAIMDADHLSAGIQLLF